MRDIQGCGEHLVGRLFVKRPLRCYLNDPLGPTPPSPDPRDEAGGGGRRALFHNQIKNQLKAISTLEKTTDKLFITWPTTRFGEVAETIYEAYHMEVKLKRKLLENVAHNCTESWKMLHLAAWVYEPFITENLIILLDSLLIETGHR
ncbi:Cyclin-dependent kinase 2-interacting protein [Trachymyrmex septentrionalis]|uniref:Cyclin-dependent kinase 2-interacting protein n=1 Tax=Trachymyrmex septentrionalis TaxID=34720 RepID=A0A195FSA3_9HYME|nr:Cyclin-dependent kinase 2-interacting protein [Trachymyrmex septentrionalis]